MIPACSRSIFLMAAIRENDYFYKSCISFSPISHKFIWKQMSSTIPKWLANVGFYTQIQVFKLSCSCLTKSPITSALYSTKTDDDNPVFLIWSQLLQQQCCRNPQSGCKMHRVLKGNKQQSWRLSGGKNLIQWLACALGFPSPHFLLKLHHKISPFGCDLLSEIQSF